MARQHDAAAAAHAREHDGNTPGIASRRSNPPQLTSTLGRRAKATFSQSPQQTCSGRPETHAERRPGRRATRSYRVERAGARETRERDVLAGARAFHRSLDSATTRRRSDCAHTTAALGRPRDRVATIKPGEFDV